MYSQDPQARRRRLKLRFFYYGITTVTIIIVTVISILFVLGYRLSLGQNSVNVSRGGLLKFNTQPTGADVFFDGTRLATATPHQVNIASGQHEVSYSKTGYQQWQKKVTMHPGELLLLNYARLIPNSITTTSLRALPNLHQSLASADREWLALHETADSPAFTIADIRDERKVAFTTVVLAEAAFTRKPNVASSFQLVSWSKESKFLLVKHTSGADIEYIRVARDDQSQAINITKLFGTALFNVQFANNNANILYATDQTSTLYRFDTTEPARKDRIAEAVHTFAPLNDTKVAYITPTQEVQKKDLVLQIWQRGTQKATTVQTIPDNAHAYLMYHAYLSHEYLSIIVGTNMVLYQDPLHTTRRKTLQNKTLSFVPTTVASSPGGRFVMAQAGEIIANYDIELNAYYNISAPSETRLPAQWVDDHHLVLTGGGNARFVEFDGSNTQQVTQVVEGFDSLIGFDGYIFLSIGRNSASSTLELQQSQLLTEADRNTGLF